MIDITIANAAKSNNNWCYGIITCNNNWRNGIITYKNFKIRIRQGQLYIIVIIIGHNKGMLVKASV